MRTSEIPINKYTMNLFDDLIRKFAACFPENMKIRMFEKEDVDIFNFTNYQPDAILYYNNRPVAVIEIKVSIVKKHIPTDNFHYQLDRYCRSGSIPFGVCLTSDKLYIVSDEDDFATLKPYEYQKGANIIYERMSSIANEPSDILDEFIAHINNTARRISLLDKEVVRRIANLTETDFDWTNINSTATTITLSDTLETNLFKAVLGNYNHHQICRYTTRESLFRILNDEKQSLCSIVGMNDKSECYYVDDYFSRKNRRSKSAGHRIDPRQNNYFITSCTQMGVDTPEKPRMEDDLSMWRMYANDCKGVCLVCDVDDEMIKDNGYILAPISYATHEIEKDVWFDEDGNPDVYEFLGYKPAHPELDFIYDILNTKVCGYTLRLPHLDSWKHFFKSHEYRDENEVRLMYVAKENENLKWIQANNIFCPVVEKSIKDGENAFPLKIRKIILGPKFTEKEVNQIQLKLHLMKSAIIDSSDISVEISGIDNYR